MIHLKETEVSNLYGNIVGTRYRRRYGKPILPQAADVHRDSFANPRLHLGEGLSRGHATWKVGNIR